MRGSALIGGLSRGDQRSGMGAPAISGLTAATPGTLVGILDVPELDGSAGNRVQAGEPDEAAPSDTVYSHAPARHRSVCARSPDRNNADTDRAPREPPKRGGS